MDELSFKKIFDRKSIYLLILLILSFYINYLFLTSNNSLASFYLLIGTLLYFGYELFSKLYDERFGENSKFNQIFEVLTIFSLFVLPLFVFGFETFNFEITIVFMLMFFALSSILSLSRNFAQNKKNYIGWPHHLNGLFFPLIYFIAALYLGKKSYSIFVLYYLVIGILSLTQINFINTNKVNL